MTPPTRTGGTFIIIIAAVYEVSVMVQKDVFPNITVVAVVQRSIRKEVKTANQSPAASRDFSESLG